MGTRRWRLAAIGALLLALGPVGPQVSAGPGTAAPMLFGIRLEGYAVRTTAFTTASSANPGSGYSFAKIDSNPGYDGGRQLEMKVVASNNDPGDLVGAVVFSPSSPFNGSNLPGYADAYFPTFEGYSQISEKCAANASNREAPECRDQTGPYALAQVVPDQTAPRALGLARNAGDGEAGQTVSRSEIVTDDTGSVVAVQDNRGVDLHVPGTPINVDFVATSTVIAGLDSVDAASSCTAEVHVGGQRIESNDQLQQALGQFAAATGVRVEYQPPTAAQVVETGDGGREVSCTGAQFTVMAPVQGQSGVTYTYGRTFAASSHPDNPSYSGAAPAGASGPTAPLAPSRPTAPTAAPALGAPPSPAPSPALAAVAAGAAAPSAASSGQAAVSFINRRIDTMPLAIWTALAAGLLSGGVWLLLGVTGSLARDLPRLRLPPFRP